MIKVFYESTKSKARVLEVTLPSGRKLQTPCFVPVGTNTLVKTLTPHQVLNHVKPGLIFLNTYHLMIQPGVDVIDEAGG